MYCKSCLRQIKDDCIICPYCGKGRPQSRKLVETDNMPLGYSPKKNKLLLLGIFSTVVFLLLLTLAPNMIYHLKIQRFHDAVRDAAVVAEEVCDIIKDVWHDSVYQIDREHTREYTQWSGRFYDDFEYALEVLDSSVYMKNQKKVVLASQHDIEKIYKSLKHYPNKYQNQYECADLMYQAYNLLVKLASNQDGFSYIEYSETLEKSADAFWTASEAFILYEK